MYRCTNWGGRRRAAAVAGDQVSLPVDVDPSTITGGRAERLESRHLMSVATWDGGSVSTANWTDPANWVGDVAPSAGDDLVFGSAGDRPLTNNDFPANTAFNSITVESRGDLAGGYNLAGNAVTLTNGVEFDVSSVTNSAGQGLALPIEMAGPQSFVTVGANAAGFGLSASDVDTNGHELTLDAAAGTLLDVRGVVSGSGSVKTAGDGRVRLWRANTHAGGTTAAGAGAGSLSAINYGSAGSASGTGTLTVEPGGELNGSGRVGAVNVAGLIDPDISNWADTLYTGSLTFQNTATYHFGFDATFLPSNDRLNVTGLVSLGGAALVAENSGNVPMSSAVPITIIDNDGIDPVSGTFAGLPEGATFTPDSMNYPFRIHYHAGDGNDVGLAVVPSWRTRTWDGGGADGNWTTAANWDGDVAPSRGDALVFPPSGARRTNTNDFPAGTEFDSITFNDAYSVSGNAIGLRVGGIRAEHAAGVTTLATPINLIDSQSIVVAGAGAQLTLSGNVSLGANQLTLLPGSGARLDVDGTVTGSGRVSQWGAGESRLTGANQYAGATVHGSGTLFASSFDREWAAGALGLDTGLETTLAGWGTIGGTLFARGDVRPGFTLERPGVLAVDGNLTLGSAARFEVVAHVNAAGSGYDQLDVAGAVNLGGAALDFSVDNAFAPKAGQSYVIVNNDGSDAVTGTFSGRADESTFTAPGSNALLRIDYQGGDGNDVAVEVVTPGTRAISTWDGGGADNNWFTPANWVGDVVPAVGDDIVFPAGAPRKTVANNVDKPYGSITFQDAGYSVSGAGVQLYDGITYAAGSGTAGPVTVAMPIRLFDDQAFRVTGTATGATLGIVGDVISDAWDLTLDPVAATANIDVAGYITINGSVTKTGDGGASLLRSNTYGGGTTVAASSGALYVIDQLADGGSQTGSGAVTIGTTSELRGNGRVGDLTVNGSLLPGAAVGTAGTLRTGNLAFASSATYGVNLDALGSNDRLDVTGTVSLGDATLTVEKAAGFTLAVGQSVTLIANDGADPVVGTFAGIANGASVPGLTGFSSYRVYYAGGDGNDVVLKNVGSTRTWDGGGGDNNWTTAANWVDDVVPVVYSDLVFPAGAARKSSTNNFAAGTMFSSITIKEDGYTLAGNKAFVLNEVFYNGLTGTSTVAMPVQISGTRTFRVYGGPGTTLRFTGEISGAGALRLNPKFDGTHIEMAGRIAVTGGGGVLMDGRGSAALLGVNTYTGDTEVGAVGEFFDVVGTLYVNHSTGTFPLQTGNGDVIVRLGRQLRGHGRVANVRINGGLIGPGAAIDAVGTLRTRTLDVSSSDVELNLATASSFDRIEVTGTVDIDQSDLLVYRAPDFSLEVGQSITVIDNNLTDPVFGTFEDLPEGAPVPGLASSYRITYVGGDGNDVAITRVAPPPAGEIGFAEPAVTVDEAAGQLTLTVTRTGGSGGTVTADYTFFADTASNGVDFTGAAGTLTFADGETSKTIVVPIADDTSDEPGDGETFDVTLGNFTGGAGAGHVIGVLVTIADNDDDDAVAGPAVLVFSQPDHSVAEAGGALAVTVLRTGDTSKTVTARFRTAPKQTHTLDDAAFAGDDYTAVETTLTFGPGETSKVVEIPVVNDATRERDERFSLVLDQPGEGAVTDPADAALAGAVIVNDDPNASPFAVGDIATGVAGQEVVIDVRTNDGDADGDDLSVDVIVTPPANGTATAKGPFVTYTAAAGFSGTDTFTYRLDDGWGGTATGTVTVVTGGSAELADPADPTKTVLVTGGSGAADKISFMPKRGGGVEVRLNGRSQGVFNPTGRIIAGTGAGNDRVTVGKLAVPVQLDAGEGDDMIAGTRFNDVLIGGPGNDRISGGAGRDLLIGGAGADRLTGGADDDILVGGGTGYAADTAAGRVALQALLAAWAANADYAARVAQLAAGVGEAGAITLAAGSIERDGARDTLVGDAGRELFFAVLDPAAEPDLVKGRKKDETAVAV